MITIRNDIKLIAKLVVLSVFVFLFVRFFPKIVHGGAVIYGVSVPLILGCIMAYILNIFMSIIENRLLDKIKNRYVKKFKRVISFLSSLIIIVLLLGLLFKLVVPQLIDSFGVITSEAPKTLNSLQQFLIKTADNVPQLQKYVNNIDLNWESVMNKLFEYVSSGINNLVSSILSLTSAILSLVAEIVFAFIFAIYILFNKETLQRQFNKMFDAYLSKKVIKRMKYVLNITNDTFTSYIIGQCIEAVILGSLCTAGMMVLRLPYAAMVGATVGVSALIPIAGAYIGAAIGAFMIFTISPLKAITFLIFLTLLQQFEGNVIYPRVVGSSIGLPGIWVMAVVIFGGGLAGIKGMLFGVPIAATLYKLLRNDVNTRIKIKAAGAKDTTDKIKDKAERISIFNTVNKPITDSEVDASRIGININNINIGRDKKVSDGNTDGKKIAENENKKTLNVSIEKPSEDKPSETEKKL